MKLEFKIMSVLLLVSAVLFFSFAGKTGSANNVRVSENDPVIGNADAPVTIVMFGDFMCHYTQQFFEETFPRLKEAYVDNGKVKIMYKQFASLNESKIESEASLCANDQGKFWQLVPLLFKIGKNATQENLTVSLLESANETGIDLDVFSKCMEMRLHREDVERDYDEGIRVGMPGTPTFFINGFKIEGFITFERFDEVLSKFQT